MATNAPSGSELAQAFLNSVRVSLGIAADLRSLSVWNILGGAIGAVESRVAQAAVNAFDGVLLERATGNQLDAYCTARGPVSRKPATNAVGFGTLTRATATAGGGTIPAGTQFTAATYTYVTQSDYQVGATALYAQIPIVATQAGAAPGAIGTVAAVSINAGLLFDPSFTATTLTVANGADVETDDALKARQRAWERGKRGGVRASVAYGALTVPSISHVVTCEAWGGLIGGYSVVYVGDDGWASTSLSLANVTLALESWRPWGPSVSVRSMSQQDVVVSLAITMVQNISNYSYTALQTAAARSALDYFNNRTDPYAYNSVMLAGRIARIHDEVQSVDVTISVGGSVQNSVINPLSPSSITINNGPPAVLTRYRLLANNVTSSITGPQ